MAPPAKKGDQDTFNFGPGMCWSYPPDALTNPQETVTVMAGGQPLVLHGPLLPPLMTGAWTGICGPIPQPAPPQPRVIISGVNRKVQAEGRLVAVIGDKTNPPGFAERLIFGPGLVNARVFIC